VKTTIILTLKILGLSLILTIPMGLFTGFIYLDLNSIPSWNIGIRNLFIIFKNYSVFILFISYFTATLLVISIADKMVVRSLFALHLAVFLAGGIFAGGTYLSRYRSYPLTPRPEKINIGYLTFFKEDVFNRAGDKLIMIKRGEKGIYSTYLYSKNENKLVILPQTIIGKKNKNYLDINESKKEVTVTFNQKGKIFTWSIPFKDFLTQESFIKNKLTTFYLYHLKALFGQIRKAFLPQKKSDQIIFIIAMLISALLIAIPASYALNDGGWGFAGITGVLFLLGFLPFFYRGVILIILKFNIKTIFLKNYSYLFLATVFAAAGIVIDLIITVRGSRGRI